MRFFFLQPLGFLLAAVFVTGGALQHSAILLQLGPTPHNLEKLKIGLGYDLMHGSLLAGLVLLATSLFLSRPIPIRRALSLAVGAFYLFLFVDYTYFTQFGTHLPFSTIEYLAQLGDFTSSMISAFLGLGFWGIFFLPLCGWLGLLFLLSRFSPGWFRLRPAYKDAAFWLLVALLAGISPNSKVDKNLNDPLTSNGLLYFYWSKGFEKPEAVPKPQEALARISAHLPGEVIDDPAFEGYPLAREVKPQGCRQRTALAWALCRKRQPNVLFILLESFRAADMGAYGGDLNLTPGFDRLKREGVFFENFFANGFQTRHGQVASYCSMVPNYGAAAMRQYLGNQYRCLPELLKEQGYATSILFGTSAAFDSQDRFLPQAGFGQVIDSLAFDGRVERLGWGVSDREAFNKWLDHLSHQEEPFFSSLLTITNHHPFTVPKSFRIFGAKDDQHRYFEALHYTDQMLYEFVQKAKTQSWWDNTLIFVLADTSNYQLPQVEPKTFEEFVRLRSQIPLLILGGALRGRSYEIETYHDQLDLAPTVMDILRQPYRASFAGQSLLGEGDLALTNRPGNYWAVLSSKGAVYSENDRQIHRTEGTPNELAEEFEALGLAWIKAQRWLLQEDRIWPKEIQ